ncbi:MAG TPA: helix-turn-helix transcriptional regulator, partial [Candidatus Dormibacteraeota bacterium]|nr:helix-turn-helix transcriptional regulator [Candidatus Dormibacteraeota bacterium]
GGRAPDTGQSTEPGAPDEAAARDLDRAADAARHRRAPGVAARALERAAALSPRAADRARRLSLAAEAALAADDRDHARTLLDQADPLAADPAVRARLDLSLARLEVNGSPAAALARLMRATEAASAIHHELAGPILAFAGAAAWYIGDWRRLAEVAERASDLPGPSGPFVGQMIRDLAGPFAPGARTAVNPLASAIDLFESVGPSPWPGPPAPVIDLVGHEAPARRAYERMVAACRAQGRIARLIDTLIYLAWTDLYTGRWASAAAAATEGLRLCRDTEQQLASAYLGVLCRLAALRGDARLGGQLAAEQRAATGSQSLRAVTTWSLALLDLGEGNASAAMDRLAGLASLDSWPDHRVAALQASADLVEAAARCGDRDVAERVLAAYEAWAGPDAAPVVRLRVHCGHALLAAGADAETRFRAALAVSGLQRPFEKARVHLLYGEWLLTEGRRPDARAALREAVRTFDRLGAIPWARRARRRLRAAGATVRRRQLRPVDRLTPEALPVARLAAQGLGHREIAALLFIGPQTVRARLAGVLATLGITTRAELSALDLDDSPDRAALP